MVRDAVAAGWDPGSVYAGFAVLWDGAPLPRLELHRIRVGLTNGIGAAMRRIGPIVETAAPRPGAICGIERPPPMLRQDQHRHHNTGVELGTALGLAAGELDRAGWSVQRVPVSDWRAAFFSFARERGVPVDAPSKDWRRLARVKSVRRVDDGFEVRWIACEHVGHEPTFERVHNMSAGCPTCFPSGLTARAEWKASVAEIVGHLWPAEYTALVLQARERSDKVHDHELPGVADACDAVGLAVWALAT